MAVASGTKDPTSVASLRLVAATVGAVLAGIATFGNDLLTPWGNATVTVLATIAGFVVIELVENRTPQAMAALVLCIAGGTVAAVEMKEQPPPGVAALIGGCEPFTVFAQDRWNPRGATSRAAPLPTARPVDGYGGNSLISVDGWVRTQPPYPHNPAPFDSEVWFHLADDSGWVAFAAVRADSVPFDPTGLSRQGGRPAALANECSGQVRWRNHED